MQRRQISKAEPKIERFGVSIYPREVWSIPSSLAPHGAFYLFSSCIQHHSPCVNSNPIFFARQELIRTDPDSTEQSFSMEQLPSENV